MKKKKLDIKKMDRAFARLREKLEKDPEWRAWMESGGPAWIEKAANALERIKPSQEEMLLDLVEADLKIEPVFGNPEILVKKKDEVISALWKLLKITKWARGESIEVLDNLEEGE